MACEGLQRNLQPAAKIRHQDLDPGRGRQLANPGYAGSKVAGAAIPKVVAVNAGNDDILELHRRDGTGELLGLVRIRRQRLAVADVAERASAGAQVTEDHEGRRPLAETFTDIRTGGLLADRVQVMLAQYLLDLTETRRRVAGLDADPGRLLQRCHWHHLDWDARGLGFALLFLAHSSSCKRMLSLSPTRSGSPSPTLTARP